MTILVVSGMARCGTSMMMGALHAAGHPIFAEQMHYPFETPKTNLLPHNWSWLWCCDGAAVKILDPLHFTPPRNRYKYRVIYMTRNHVEQAKSHLKFVSVGFWMDFKRGKISTEEFGVLRRDIEQRLQSKAKLEQYGKKILQDNKKALRLWKRLGAQVLTITFEEALKAPKDTFEKKVIPFVPYLGCRLHEDESIVDKMAATIKCRSAEANEAPFDLLGLV